MGLYDYKMSQELDRLQPPFPSLIMAALRKADDNNARLLRSCWPEIAHEMYLRYHTPGGLLPHEAAALPED